MQVYYKINQNFRKTSTGRWSIFSHVLDCGSKKIELFFRFVFILSSLLSSIPFSISVLNEIWTYIYIYMSYRSYPVYRSCNFDKVFIEIATSIENIDEVTTSIILHPVRLWKFCVHQVRVWKNFTDRVQTSTHL